MRINVVTIIPRIYRGQWEDWINISDQVILLR